MRSKAMAALSIVAGIACALAVAAYTGAVRDEAEAARAEALAKYGGAQVEVCVAMRDLAPGEVADASNTEQRAWLVDLLPADAVESPSRVEGMRLSSSVLAGEVLSLRRFEGAAQPITVPSGMQAVSVEVDASRALGGAIDAGTRVDVYATGANGAQLIVPRAAVLAVGSGSGSRMWTTLAVAPERVQELIATTQSASLYFALPSDEGEQ